MKTLLLASLLLLLFALPATAGDAGRRWNVLVIDKDPKGANVRESPAGKVIKAIPFGNGDTPRLVQLTGQAADWFNVEVDGAGGWMHGSMLGTCASATEDGAPSLSKGPHIDSPLGVKVPADAPVRLLGMYKEWLQVRYVDAKGKSHDGWLMEQALAISENELEHCARAWARR
ncbi:hypothetical protein [Solidesulfovibrio sp. C21]|uniref:hypothetical protein n=1 Tax=Solidesulfovibrio sp. C21 TaxID=3398613 RepID=UPI0039FCACE0